MLVLPSNTCEDSINHLLTSLITPRPIAWISSISANGISNLAPFSAFAPICNDPPTIVFSAGLKKNRQRKDTVKNILTKKEFVVNLVEENQLQAMAKSSCELPFGKSEIEWLQLPTVASEKVSVPRIQDCRVSLECRLFQHLNIKTTDVIFGEIVAFWIDDSISDDFFSEKKSTCKPIFSPVGALDIDYYIALTDSGIRHVITPER